MTPKFCNINVNGPAARELLRYLNHCGWEGDDAYITQTDKVQVRIRDEQDRVMLERALATFPVRIA